MISLQVMQGIVLGATILGLIPVVITVGIVLYDLVVSVKDTYKKGKIV